jgi:ferritin
MTYIIDRDGHVELYQINQPDSEFKDIQDVFEKALAHEKFVTEQVNNLYALADKENDYATKIKMQWFIEEQVEEEKTFKEIIQQIKRIGGNNTALFLFDQKMNERQETPDTVQQ